MSEPQAADKTKDQGSARSGLAWLLADMTLVTGMTVLVKASASTYPAIQLVFIRAAIGLVFILPLMWRHRQHLRHVRHPWRNISRIACNAVALSSNFIAIGLLPLATVNAMGFSRPLVTMALAVLLLQETVSKLRWAGAAIAFLGVLVIVSPSPIVWNLGLAAILASVVFGALATIQTRMLREENTTVMMVFYTTGLAVLTAVPAYLVWVPVQTHDWGSLLMIGMLAQAGQYCWLRAYQSTSASLLAPIGYLSVVFSAAAGFLFFSEIPEPQVFIGVVVILVALQGSLFLERRIAKKASRPTIV